MAALRSGSGKRVSARSDRFAEALKLQNQGRLHRAAAAYWELGRTSPGDPAIFNNLGNCLRALGEFEKAIRCFDHALELEPGRATSRLNRSLALLSLNRYHEAWADYEARLEVIDFRRELLEHPESKWQGETLSDGETLYLFGNQGLGDEIQCFRFFKEVAARVGNVILELQRPLISLAGQLPENVTVIERGDPVPAFHRWAEFFSLPGLLGTAIDSLPQPTRFSFEENGEVRHAIGAASEEQELRVGLVWSGSPGNSLNGIRACGLGHLQSLLRTEGCRFFSLQLGAPSNEIEQLGLGDRITDLAPCLNDFAATATAIEELDLVITTDTSVPHLAGSQGAETWLLLHRPADWRWGQQGERCAWYPSLRLFRQERMRDWGPVVEEVKSALQQRVAGHQP